MKEILMFSLLGGCEMDKKKKRSIIRGIILLVLACAIIYTIYNSATKEKVEALADGDQAPDFELVDLEGNTHRLSDYKGQGVFLNFWGTWCEPCKKEMPAMERQYQQFKDQGVQVLAVNIAQSKFEVQNFVDQYDLTFPVVIDKTKSVMQAYNVGRLPATYLISPDGKVKKIPPGELSEQQIQSFMESIKPE
jgi:peroxiredoxin